MREETMATTISARSLATLWITAGLICAPHGLVAQEEQAECVLEASPEATAAATALDEAMLLEDPAEARAKFQEAWDAVDGRLREDPAPYILGAQALVGLRQFAQADSLLVQFEVLAPECVEVHARNARYNAWVGLYNEGIQAYQSGDLDAALEAFNTANMMFADARSYNNAGILYEQTGQPELALENYRKAIVAEGDEEQKRNAVLSLASLVAAEGTPDEALPVYERYLEDSPDDVVVRIRYALALTDAGRGAEATGIFEDVLSRDDLTAEQWIEVGVGLFNSEDYASAAMAFGKSRSGNPYGKEAMENYVNAAIQANQMAEALPLADSLVAWYPYDASEYQLLASGLAKSGEDDQALRLLQVSQTTPIIFHSSQMADLGGGQYVIRGVVEAREAVAGQTVTIPFEFVSATGDVLGSENLTLQLPAAGQTETFRLDFQSAVPVAGFRYAKVEGL
jgi:tetratricopeptide (TPR) repeat protein